MNVIDTDIIRSMLIGQTLWVLIWLTFVFLLLIRSRLRPGAMTACVLLAVGNYAALLAIMAHSIASYGQAATYKTWLTAVAVMCSSFGYVMIAMHLVFHDDNAITALRNWFKKI